MRTVNDNFFVFWNRIVVEEIEVQVCESALEPDKKEIRQERIRHSVVVRRISYECVCRIICERMLSSGCREGLAVGAREERIGVAHFHNPFNCPIQIT
jgi:hypothetical protein